MPLFNYNGNPYARHHMRPPVPGSGVQASSQVGLPSPQPQQSFQTGMAGQPLQQSFQTGMSNSSLPQLSTQQMAPVFNPIGAGGMQNLFGLGGMGMLDPNALLLHLMSQNPYGNFGPQ